MIWNDSYLICAQDAGFEMDKLIKERFWVIPNNTSQLEVSIKLVLKLAWHWTQRTGWETRHPIPSSQPQLTSGKHLFGCCAAFPVAAVSVTVTDFSCRLSVIFSLPRWVRHLHPVTRFQLLPSSSVLLSSVRGISKSLLTVTLTICWGFFSGFPDLYLY